MMDPVTFPNGMKAVAAWTKSLLDQGYAGKPEFLLTAKLAKDGITPDTISDDGVKVYHRIVALVQKAPVRDYSSGDPSAYAEAGLTVGADMEKIMGQIEQDVLYGDEVGLDAAVAIPAVKPKLPAVPAISVSPTGVVTKNPEAPASAALPDTVLTKPGALKSMVDFLKKPAGPLPVYGWGLIGLAATGSVIALGAAVWKKY